MQAPLRRYITAGVALVGASAIAVASNAAAPPEITIANPAVPSVQLTASPFDPYLAALAEARENIEDLILQAIADPALPPGLSLENLIGGLIDDPEANFEAFVAGRGTRACPGIDSAGALGKCGQRRWRSARRHRGGIRRHRCRPAGLGLLAAEHRCIDSAQHSVAIVGHPDWRHSRQLLSARRRMRLPVPPSVGCWQRRWRRKPFSML